MLQTISYSVTTGTLFAMIGRFLSVDPVGFMPDDPSMFNRYAYAGGDPINSNDPDGRCSKGPCRRPINHNRPPIPGGYVPPNPSIEFLVDMSPGIGDLKGAYEAYQDPTPVNVIGAIIGVVPLFGDAAKGALKSADEVFDALVDGSKATTDDALDAATRVLGDNPNQIADGVFRSQDGTRQVRFTDNDLSDPRGAHMNFERGQTITKPNGSQSFVVEENKHIFLPEEN